MLSGAPIILPAAATQEVREYLRIVGQEEQQLLERLTLGAVELCEQFTGRILIARSFTELVGGGKGSAQPFPGSWRRLGATPVTVISGVETVSSAGSASTLEPGSYAVDIDANGDGWVRITALVAPQRIRVTFEAGMASAWAQLPEALKQGVVRLAAHLYTHRDDAEGAGPPAAVTALWRPWRRLRLH